MLQAFHFSDPRQQRIYEELKELVGPGPAAFFRDACWLMANPNQLESTTHLVAHLLRELESALRGVFRPMAQNGAEGSAGSAPQQEQQEHEEGEKEGQKKEIRAILRSLEIPEDAPEARAWFELAKNLHSLAHRRGLHAPRPPREISELWDRSQALLDVLLRSLREHFLTWIRKLDELLAKRGPNKHDLKRLAQEIPNNLVTRGYFFNRLQHPGWLHPLWSEGFFRRPPAAIRDEEEGTIRFPPWPEARYLSRMAPHKPDLVAEIIQEMDDTDNAAVLSDLLDALLAMPPDAAPRLVEKAARWAESPYFLVPGKLGQLVAHWASAGRTTEALRVARVLLDVLPDEHRLESAPEEDYRLPPEPRARFDTWNYEEILKKHYPELVMAAGLPALELLCDLLDRAIRLSRRRDDDQGPEDYSVIWRPAIEDHLQNDGHTIKDALVTAVCDAAELVVRSGQGTAEEVVNALERRPWKVFRRIALHVLQVFPDQAEALAAERLTDRALFEDVGLRHEYVLLLRDCFQRLTHEDRATILGWIEAGPDVEKFKRWREEATGSPPSDDSVARREIWQRDWLARIRPENLPGELQERYRELVGKYGEPNHVEFPVYTESGWVGPTSPKSVDELKAMSVQEIVEFLKTWRPPDNAFCEPSPEGLGRVLSSVVAQDPGPFAVEAKRFQGLDPTYIRAVLSGLRDALKQGGTFDWEPVLDLCGWALSQPRESPGRQVGEEMEADLDWGWTRKTIADLLSTGFDDGPGSIPIRLRVKVWHILKPLSEDPEPTPEHEERYGGSNMDPATLSINTTRGEAMHAVVRYALWVRRHMEGQADAEDQPRRGFDEMPEVREVLDAHLDVAQEPSLAIRAVYGQWFPWLVLLDSEWARDNATRIFPIGQGEEALLQAAWNSYVTFCRPYDNVLDILREQYRHAAERIGCRRDDTRWLANPDERLVEHLMAFYWRGKLSLEDPLFTAFWEKATDALRGHALGYVGRALKQTIGEIPAEVLDRLTQLWAVRLARAKQSQSRADLVKEMAAFGWWFVSDKFDVGWAIAQLSESLQLVHQTDPYHRVLEYLERTVETHPVESIQCLRLIAEGDREGWNLSAGRDHVRRILEVALRNPTAGEEAERIIHYLGSRGFLEFRNLLEGERRG
ncbi:MAG: hypothetical protein KM310_10995 [Clostridiales bacterium]|nr:hypothetical protein [Clostridiales bacterium]